MSCQDDKVLAQRSAVKNLLSILSNEQIEAIMALWAYSSNRNEAVVAYMVMECNVSKKEAKYISDVLRNFDLVLF